MFIGGHTRAHEQWSRTSIFIFVGPRMKSAAPRAKTARLTHIFPVDFHFNAKPSTSKVFFFFFFGG